MVIDKNTWIPIVESFKKWKASFGWMKSRLLPLKSLETAKKMIGDNPTIFGAQTVDQGRLRDGDLTYERPRTENRPSSFRHSTSWYIVVSRRMPRDLMWKRRRTGHKFHRLSSSILLYVLERAKFARREPFTS